MLPVSMITYFQGKVCQISYSFSVLCRYLFIFRLEPEEKENSLQNSHENGRSVEDEESENEEEDLKHSGTENRFLTDLLLKSLLIHK